MKSKSTDAREHVGHIVGVDKWAEDFGGRKVLFNGWCANCGCAVAIEVFTPGVLTQAALDASLVVQNDGNLQSI